MKCTKCVNVSQMSQQKVNLQVYKIKYGFVVHEIAILASHLCPITFDSKLTPYVSFTQPETFQHFVYVLPFVLGWLSGHCK